MRRIGKNGPSLPALRRFLEVVCVAFHGVTDEEMVVYRDLETARVFVLPLELFPGVEAVDEASVRQFTPGTAKALPRTDRLLTPPPPQRTIFPRPSHFSPASRECRQAGRATAAETRPVQPDHKGLTQTVAAAPAGGRWGFP